MHTPPPVIPAAGTLILKEPQVQAEKDLNLEIEKVIGHERHRNCGIRFLLQVGNIFR